MTPDLGELGSTDFQRLGLAIDRGAAAAVTHRADFARFAVADAEWQAFATARLERRMVPKVEPATLAFVDIQASTPLQRRWLEAALSAEQGQPFAAARVERRVAEAYGRDVFETIDWRVVSAADGATGLQVVGRGKSWGPNFLTFGLDLQDDLDGNNSFNAGVRLLLTELNASGAEWRTDFQFGETPRLAAEFHQPLGLASPWFMAPRILLESRNVPVMANGERVAEFRVREARGGVDLGREFGLCCELRFGFQRALGSLRLRVGDATTLPTSGPLLDPSGRAEYSRREWFGRFTFDGLDNVHFPREGSYFSMQWTDSREQAGVDRGSDRLEFSALRAWTAGRHTLVLGLDGGSTVSTPSGDVDRLFQLGGFLRLSGLPTGSLSGAHYALARAVLLRKIGRGGNGFFNVPAWAGVAVEAGNAWATRREATFGGLRKDAALFLGLDTGLGPVYLGGGLDGDGNSAWYLFLGRGF
jgi:NTE family protein